MVRILPTIPAWGFETKACHSESSKTSNRSNLWKVLGYFPVTGTLIACIKGIRLLDSLCKKEKLNCEEFQFYVIRGAFEVTGFAFLTLPFVDACVTAYRECKAKKIDPDLGDFVDVVGDSDTSEIVPQRPDLPKQASVHDVLSELLRSGANVNDATDSEEE